MTGGTSPEPGRPPPPALDTGVAHPARVYDCWLGGKDNYAADREAAVLQNIGPPDDPHALVARLLQAVVPASYLVLSHPASDIMPEAMARMARSLNERQREAEHARFRSRAEITRFFDGLELCEPGVVQPHRWRPGPGPFVPDHDVSAWCGVARKP